MKKGLICFGCLCYTLSPVGCGQSKKTENKTDEKSTESKQEKTETVKTASKYFKGYEKNIH